jgi:hypothetical protein
VEFEAKEPLTRTSAKLALALALALVVIGLFAAQASAITLYHHPLLGAIGPKGAENGGQFVRPHAVAVDPGSGDVYVMDLVKEGTKDENYLYRFTAAGAPDPFTAGPGAGTNAIQGLVTVVPLDGDGRGVVAVAPPGAPGGTAGDVYVVVNGKVEVYSGQGAHIGTIDATGNPHSGGTAAAAVTVDPSGNLYVFYDADEAAYAHVDKYVPSANPPNNADFDSELRVEVDLCVLAATSSALYTTAVECSYTTPSNLRYPLTFPGGGGSALATAEKLSLPPAYASFSLAVDTSNEDLYVGGEHEFSENNKLFHAGIDQYDAAGNLLAFLNLEETPQGLAVSPTSGRIYVGIRSNSEERDVRIYGDGEPVQPPSATIDPVASFDFRSAHFTGTVNPGGSGDLQETAYRFVCSPACPGLEGERTVAGDGSDHAVSDDAAELQPETTYEVRLIARNLAVSQAVKAGTVESATSFETPPKPPAEAPEVSIDPVTEFGSESAHLTGTVDPNGAGPLQETTYRFEYSQPGGEWTSVGDQGPIEGDGPQPVSADIEGLEPNTTYEVRLSAENVGGEATSPAPNPSFTTAAVAPLVEVTAATQVLTDSAQLNGRIDPRNSQTTYYFEWGTGNCASNPCTSVPVAQDGDAGAGGEFIWVKAQVSGLQPSQSYSYRLVAENSAGETVGASAPFTTEAPSTGCANEDQRVGASAALPDCRAYEMVSPANKGGGNITTMPQRTRVAADGEGVTFKSTAAFAGAVGAPFAGIEYMSLRGADGWQTHAISPYQAAPFNVPEQFFTGSGYSGSFSPDLEAGVYRALAPIPGATTEAVANRPNVYLATGLRSAHPEFQLLSDTENPLPPFSEDNPYIAFADASDGFGKIVFETQDNLTPETTGPDPKLYEWEDGALRLAGVLPDSACGSPPCPAPESRAGAGAIVPTTFPDGTNTDADHVVSADGSRVFFTVGGNKIGQTSGFSGRVYARIDGGSTVQIDASERENPDPSEPGHSLFGAASADGDVVYFISEKALVDADTDGRMSLYIYEFEKPAGERLTYVPNTAGVSQVLGVSKAGDFAYVKTNTLLVVHKGTASEITDYYDYGNLYLEDRTAYGRDTFRLTPNGRSAVFMSGANLVGYDTTGPCQGATCAQVYLYSFDAGELTCVSCNFGHPALSKGLYIGDFGPEGNGDVALVGANDTNHSEPLTRDGRYVFFSTEEPLVAADSNGKSDAYVYDTEKQELRLLSSGQCNCRSRFIGASPNGHDVFFTTYDRLVRADSDTQVDVYDARIGGGIASQNAIPPAECQGDACQSAPASPPETTPASVSFSGPGSPPPTRKVRHRHKKRHAHHHRRKKQRSHHGASSRRAGHVEQGGSK